MRRRAMPISAAMIALCALIACDGDPKPGARGPCASPTGPAIDCTPVPLDSAEDACWRLVECGAIPVVNPESEPNCCLDWAACVETIEDLPDQDFELALACLEAAPC